MRLDSAGLEILDREECLKLLAGAPIGRVIYTEQALPAVQPVTYAFHDGAVVLRTAAGSRLATATGDTVVGFQADEFHPDTGAGWSVMIMGRAAAVTDPAERAELDRLRMRQWSRGLPGDYIKIDAERASGRWTPGVFSGPDAFYR